jgi:hypothetical protein
MHAVIAIFIQLIEAIPTGGADMKCPRCEGRMFSEKFYDFVRSFDAWKCTCCGELIDSTILANRARNGNIFLG